MKGRLVYKGGAGSGHHGHQGRPGKRGGSSPGGGGSASTGVSRGVAKDAIESMLGVLQSEQFQHPSYRIVANGDEVEHNGTKYIAYGTNRRSGTVYAFPKDRLTKMLDVIGVEHTKNNISLALAYVNHKDTDYLLDRLTD